MRPYEIFDHTADTGLRVYGRDLPELFRNGAAGFFDLVTDFGKIRKKEARVRIEIEKQDPGELFLAWLRELLYQFSAKHFVFYEFDFSEIGETKLRAEASGEIFEPGRHEQKCEVKAVTYHGFKLERKENLWTAEVIFDI